jgi:hypothetical protein
MVDTHSDSLARLLSEIKPHAGALADDPPSLGVTRKNVFRHPDAHPLVLDLLLIQRYGDAWLGWEYETLEKLIPTDFDVDRVSDLNMSKIQAMKTLHLVDTFWERWEVFAWCTMPLTSIFPDFSIMQVPSVLQCMLAVDIAKRVREDVEWSEELKVYLATVHLHDGIILAQAPLDFVHVDAADYAVDVKSVSDRWASVRASKEAPKGATPEDEQLRRMLTLYVTLSEHRKQLHKQLEVVRA